MLSQLESRKGLGEREGSVGEWKWAGNLSGVAGEEGEKSRCLLSRGGGVSRQPRLVGEVFGVSKYSCDGCIMQRYCIKGFTLNGANLQHNAC